MNQLSSYQFLAPLIPVLITVFLGSWGGGVLGHWLKVRHDKAQKRREKLEELLAIANELHVLPRGVPSQDEAGLKELADRMRAIGGQINALVPLYFKELDPVLGQLIKTSTAAFIATSHERQLNQSILTEKQIAEAAEISEKVVVTSDQAWSNVVAAVTARAKRLGMN